MIALAEPDQDEPRIEPGDIYMFHQEWNAMHEKPDSFKSPPCPGILRYGQRIARGRHIQVDCDKCHFGLSLVARNSEELQDKKNRRLDRLMDDAQPTRGGEDSP